MVPPIVTLLGTTLYAFPPLIIVTLSTPYRPGTSHASSVGSVFFKDSGGGEGI